MTKMTKAKLDFHRTAEDSTIDGLMKYLVLHQTIEQKPKATFDSLFGCMKGEVDDAFLESLAEIRQWDKPADETNG